MNTANPKPLTSRRYENPVDSMLTDASTVFEADPQLLVAQEAVIRSEYHDELAMRRTKRHTLELMEPRSFIIFGRVVRVTFDVSVLTIVMVIVAVLFAVSGICFQAILQTKVPDFDFFKEPNLVLRKQLVFDPKITAAALRKTLANFQTTEYSVGYRNHYSISAPNATAREGVVHYLNRERQIPISQVSIAEVLEANSARITGSVETQKLNLEGKSSVVASDVFTQASTSTFIFENNFNFTQNTTFTQLSVGDIRSQNLTLTNLQGTGKFDVLNVSELSVRNATVAGIEIGRLGLENMDVASVEVLTHSVLPELSEPVKDLNVVNISVNGNRITLTNNTVVNSTSLEVRGSNITFSQLSAGASEFTALSAQLLSSNSSDISKTQISSTESSALEAEQVNVAGKCTFESITSGEKPVLSSNGTAEFSSVQGVDRIAADQFNVQGTYNGNIVIS